VQVNAGISQIRRLQALGYFGEAGGRGGGNVVDFFLNETGAAVACAAPMRSSSNAAATECLSISCGRPR